MRTTRKAEASGNDPRERLLEAALAAFSEHGFDGATTRDIAGRAGQPLGLIRYYFGSKLKLWQAAVDRAFGEVRSTLDAAREAPQAPEDELGWVRASIRAHVRYVAEHPEFVRLMHEEGKRRGPRMRWIVDRHAKPLFALLIPMAARLQELGRLPADVPAYHFAYALVGAIDVIFHQAEECRRLTGADPGDHAFIEDHARAVEFMLLGAPPSPIEAAAPRG